MARKRLTIVGTDNADHVIGTSYSPNTISSKVIQFTAAGSWDGNVTIKRRMFKYVDPAVGGAAVQPAAVAVSWHDETTGLDSTAAISGTTLNKIVTVRAELTEIVLTTAGGTTGSLIVDYDGIEG